MPPKHNNANWKRPKLLFSGAPSSLLVKRTEKPKISMDLKIEENIQDISNRFGLVPREKYGDTITSSNVQENLKKIVEKHYKKTKMRDYEESLKELRMVFSGSELAQLKEKFRAVKKLSESPKEQKSSQNIEVRPLNQ